MASSVEIPAGEVLDRLSGGEELYLLDVRHADAFDRWHIEGSTNLPVYDELAAGDASAIERRLDAFPADRDIVIVCNTGNKSVLPARVLQRHGYVAHSMADGMHGWGAVYRDYDTPVPGVTQVVRPGTGCLSYLVRDGGEALLVDPGLHAGVYRDLLEDADLRLVGVADTHAHADHVSGAPDLARAFDVPYYLPRADARHRRDAEPVDDGVALPVGDLAVEVVATPGHTRGSACLAVPGGLLAGDTLFVRSVGRPDLEGSDADARAGAGRLFDSLERLRGLPAETHVLPGHFSTETARPVVATLGDVLADNELCRIDDRAAFVRAVLADLPETPANYEQIKVINARGAEPAEDPSVLELGPNNCASH